MHDYSYQHFTTRMQTSVRGRLNSHYRQGRSLYKEGELK